MPYPSHSYLTPAELASALDLARQLHHASVRVGVLAYGGIGAAFHAGAGGRVASRQVAVADWVGPHRQTFDLLFEHEMDSARVTEQRLRDEADDWAAFWARAMNDREGRLHDRAMERYRHDMERYEQLVVEQHTVAAAGALPPPNLPGPPRAPRAPDIVAVPTAPDYVPTG